MLTERYYFYVGAVNPNELFGHKDYSAGNIIVDTYTAKTTYAIKSKLMQHIHTLYGMYKYVEVINYDKVIDSNDDPYEPTYDDIQADWDYIYGSDKAIAEYLSL